MQLNDKIYIAGHKGLVGSSIIRELKNQSFENLIYKTHSELDLTNQQQVTDFFTKEKPQYVFLAAAKVGGIYANNEFPADFIYNNLMIEANIIHSAYQNKTKRLLFLGSSCIYPKNATQPIQESELLTRKLEPTNEPYAIAKIAGIKLCESYNRQHNTDFRSVMPTNLYGINDNFHPQNSHVIPALIHRFHIAKINNDKEVIVWGSGKAMRDFLYVDDMAKACVFILNLDKEIYKAQTNPQLSHINIGTGKDVTIEELAKAIKETVDFKGELTFDAAKSDGTLRKLMNVSCLSNMGWCYGVALETGLKKTYEWYVNKEKQ